MQGYDPSMQAMQQGAMQYGAMGAMGHMGAPMGGSNLGFDASIGLERVFPCVRLRGKGI